MTIVEPRAFGADVLLRDGTSLHLRAIRPDDKERLADHFRRLGAESVRHRFFGAKKDLTADELQGFTEPDFDQHVGLVGTQSGPDGETIVVVGRYFRLAPAEDGVARAEFALAVADEWHGRGAGTVMLEQLARLAAAAGVERFEADVLEDNVPMLRMLAHLGFEVSERSRQGVVRAMFPVRLTENARRVSDARVAAASAQSLRALLHPRSVAVVGASRRPGTIGDALVANLMRDGFAGAIYPVNPEAAEIEGLRTYPSVAAIGGRSTSPSSPSRRPGVEAVVEECARAGVRGVVVISAGFAEVSAEGRAAQDAPARLRARVRACAWSGPTAWASLNTDPGGVAERDLRAAPAAVAATSACSRRAARSGSPCSTTRATLEHRHLDLRLGRQQGRRLGQRPARRTGRDDPRTRRRSRSTSRASATRGSSRASRRRSRGRSRSSRSSPAARPPAAAPPSSHSAALASLDVAVDALFEQAGVIRTEHARGAVRRRRAPRPSQPVPPGPRVGVVTNAGGPGILARRRVRGARPRALPELAPETLATLRAFLPPAGRPREPGRHDRLGERRCTTSATIAAVAADPERRRGGRHLRPAARDDGARRSAPAIARGAGARPARQADPHGLHVVARARRRCSPPGRAGAAVLQLSRERRARAGRRASATAAGASGRAGTALPSRPRRRSATRPRGRRARARRRREAPRLARSRTTSRTLLAAAGIALRRRRTGRARRTPAGAADALGYPLVAKAVAPGLVHKSDVGGVILGLDSAEEVPRRGRGARASACAAAGYELEGVLLQRAGRRAACEALVGVTTDPTFGPLVVCGPRRRPGRAAARRVVPADARHRRSTPGR